MSMNIPVFITKTNGFWDNNSFLDEENIILVEDNSIENWTSQLRSTFDNYEKLNKLSINGKELINQKFDIRNFYNDLKHIIF